MFCSIEILRVPAIPINVPLRKLYFKQYKACSKQQTVSQHSELPLLHLDSVMTTTEKVMLPYLNFC